jgi:transcriptional regulator with XRE-family HTH domain
MELKGKNISEQLRFALDTAGTTVYQISRATGIDEGSLSKFRRSDVGLRLETVDILAQYLNLKLMRVD